MSAKKVGGMGGGISSLFAEASAPLESRENITRIRVSHIDPNRAQPRKAFDEEALSELAESIRQHGIITPLALRRTSGGRYQIIAGERRWRAARLAGLDEVPALILEADERKALELAMIENLQREDLNPIEEAEGYRALLEEHGMTQEAAAAAVGRSRPAVANAIRLLSLSPEVREMVGAGLISGGHARALLSLDEADLQLRAAKKIETEGMSVRQTEKYIKTLLGKKEPVPAEKETAPDYIGELERGLSSRFGRKVKIEHSGKKGRISLEYYGLDDLEMLISGLRGLKE